MNSIPVVPHSHPNPSEFQERKVERLAVELLASVERLQQDEDLRPFAATTSDPGPSLHIDDLTEISGLTDQNNDEGIFFQDRCRLRAGDGDVIVSCSRPIDGYEDYCQSQLNLGRPTWLRPMKPLNRMHVAEAAWQDRKVRRELVRRMRLGRLACIHPHMGTSPVWRLASLLSKSSHRPIQVLAAPPGVSRWANDKVAFTTTATRLFGESLVPLTTSAWNLANAAVEARRIARHAPVVGFKLPDSAGSNGNVVVDSAEISGRSLTEVERHLKQTLERTNWNGSQPLLISRWEHDVLCSPSVQLWIPPQLDQPPVVEGVFVQSTTGSVGKFVGTQPARFPHAVAQEIVDRSWLLARLFQLVGYVGRCSFDLILLGEELASAKIEFIECNGRWGGTSLPMTLMNRLFRDWHSQPHAAYICQVPGLSRLPFQYVVAALKDYLYDHVTGQGKYILYNPGRLQSQSALSVIGLSNEWWRAADVTFNEFPNLVRTLVAQFETASARRSRDHAYVLPGPQR